MIEKSNPVIIEMWREWCPKNPDHTMTYHVRVKADSGKLPLKMFGRNNDCEKYFKDEISYLKFLHKITDWIRA